MFAIRFVVQHVFFALMRLSVLAFRTERPVYVCGFIWIDPKKGLGVDLRSVCGLDLFRSINITDQWPCSAIWSWIQCHVAGAASSKRLWKIS